MNGYYVSGTFKQYESKKYTPDNSVLPEKINAAVLFNGVLYIASSTGIFAFADGNFSRVFPEFENESITSFLPCGDKKMYVAFGKTVCLISDGKTVKKRVFDDCVMSVKRSADDLWILTEGMIIKTDPLLENDLLARPVEGGTATAFEIFGSGAYAATQTNLSVLHGKRLEWQNIFPDRSGLPQTAINDLKFDNAGFLWLATDLGAYIYDTHSFWLSPEKIAQLPENSVRKICFDGCGGTYFATDAGVAVLKNGETKYYSADRWVTSNKIIDIAVSNDGKLLYAVAANGLSVISVHDTTLAKKAAYYEEQTEKNNIRRGFVAAQLPDGSVNITDNDGLWTAWYVAGECFRYAVTGDADALKKARRGMDAILFLENISGIEGFPARAVRYKGEHGFGDGHKEWSFSPDKSCEWRGDTSSDEITGHFFGSFIYYDFCANDDEKARIRTSICKIADHIIDNSFRLVDRDGKPTTWANWNADLLNHDDRWFAERGTNSLELLMYLKVCEHMTGNKKYTDMYNYYAVEKHMLMNIVKYKIRDAHVCHIDEVLTFISSIVLLMLEKDQTLRKYILCGLDDIIQYEKTERQPLFSFVQAAFSDNDDEIAKGVRSLREMPLDMRTYSSHNSDRKGLVYDTEQTAVFEEPQLKEPLPYHEFNLTRPNKNVFRPDTFGHGAISDGTAFLLPYWFGRYMGILKEASEEK